MKTSYIKAFINDGTKSEPIPVYVLSMDEENEAVVNVNTEDKDPDEVAENVALRLWEGKLVEIGIFKGGEGVMLYTGKVAYALRERIHITILNFQGSLQRRTDVKARFSCEGIVETLFSCRQSEIPVSFRDISSGGIGFFVDKEFDDCLIINERYKTVFDKGSEPVTLCFNLLWTDELEDGRINCGGRFYNLNNATDVIIRKFVFDREREERRRMMEEIEREQLAAEIAAEQEKQQDAEEEEQSHE